jgi:hypothetical protein
LEPLKVPIKGIISDGEETIRNAVAFVFPNVPHLLCQFYALKDAIKPFYEADWHAKTAQKRTARVKPPSFASLVDSLHPQTGMLLSISLGHKSWYILSQPSRVRDKPQVLSPCGS